MFTAQGEQLPFRLIRLQSYCFFLIYARKLHIYLYMVRNKLHQQKQPSYTRNKYCQRLTFCQYPTPFIYPATLWRGF